MRIQVSAGSCTVAASPAPFRLTRPPRPILRNQVSPLRSVADRGPEEKSWREAATALEAPVA
eukprot:2462376-Alexandrium_andersonii.AAC.1